MEFFGIGPLELLLIMVVALLVLGPERLPEVARGIGKAVADFRRMTSEFSEEMRQFTDVVQEPMRDVQEAVRSSYESVQTEPSVPTEPVPTTHGGYGGYESSPDAGTTGVDTTTTADSAEPAVQPTVSDGVEPNGISGPPAVAPFETGTQIAAEPEVVSQAEPPAPKRRRTSRLKPAAEGPSAVAEVIGTNGSLPDGHEAGVAVEPSAIEVATDGDVAAPKRRTTRPRQASTSGSRSRAKSNDSTAPTPARSDENPDEA